MAGRNQERFKRFEEVLEAGRDADEERVETLRLLIAVDERAPRELVLCLKEAFMPARSGVVVDVRLVSDVAADPNGIWDACVVIAGGSDEAVEQAAAGLGRHGNPVVVVAQSVLDIPESCLSEPLSAFVDTIAASDAASLLGQLARWIIRMDSKATAFASSFPFCRQERVKDLTKACAIQNAAIGVVNLLPGSDLPYITINQAKLALDIAAVYGRPFSFGRLPEVAGVIAAGFGYRAIARILVGLIPGVGRILRGIIAYAGTLTTAQAVSTNFALDDGEIDDPVEYLRSSLKDRVEDAKDQLAERLPSKSAAKGEEVAPVRDTGSDYIVFVKQGGEA